MSKISPAAEWSIKHSSIMGRYNLAVLEIESLKSAFDFTVIKLRQLPLCISTSSFMATRSANWSLVVRRDFCDPPLMAKWCLFHSKFSGKTLKKAALKKAAYFVWFCLPSSFLLVLLVLLIPPHNKLKNCYATPFCYFLVTASPILWEFGWLTFCFAHSCGRACLAVSLCVFIYRWCMTLEKQFFRWNE